MSLLTNKRATYDYEITRKITAGIVLSGAEVKSLRSKSGSLAGSFVKIIENRPVLLGAQITPYKFADNRDYDPKRTRTLLLRRREIINLEESLAAKGLTAVPLAFDLIGGKIKLIIGLGKGKKEFEKRAKIKARELKREAASAAKYRY